MTDSGANTTVPVDGRAQPPGGGPGCVGMGFDIATFLVGAAVHAPSVHNTQPWRFSYAEDGTVELWADQARALPATDPAGRELVISCGGALATLALGVRWLGYRPLVQRCPDPARPGLLARLSLGTPYQATPLELDLFAAVLDRHTHRGPFDARPVPPKLLNCLRRLARRAGCHAVPIRGAWEWRLVARLDLRAQRVQRRQPLVRAELEAARRPADSQHRDGVIVAAGRQRPGSGQLGSRWTEPAMPPDTVPAAHGDGRDAYDRAPATMMLATGRDDAPAWLRTGEALQHLLLHAARHGVYASIHTQPLEVPATRAQLARLTAGEHPQMLLQFGYADSVPTAPRRAPAQVLTGSRCRPPG